MSILNHFLAYWIVCLDFAYVKNKSINNKYIIYNIRSRLFFDCCGSGYCSLYNSDPNNGKDKNTLESRSIKLGVKIYLKKIITKYYVEMQDE